MTELAIENFWIHSFPFPCQLPNHSGVGFQLPAWDAVEARLIACAFH
jgi:hypothetical protein